ncbi:MAG: hypothetical protein HS126_39300 [Anaerolineales bacterium]|nr:hypothetical protein [Anaerolineales bacterium]
MFFNYVKRVLVGIGLGIALLIFTWLSLASIISPDAAAAQSAAAVRFLNQAGAPIVNGTVRVLCYATPPGKPIADILVKTGADGRPTTSLPAGCTHLAALRLVHEQPSGKPGHGPAYWVYATSWPPGTTTPSPAGDIQIRDDQPLVLFNVVVSLGWEPPAGSDYLAELGEGLRQASGYLYDVTNGQMAFGPVEIYTGGDNWDKADLRFLAANDFVPLAYPGGIVTGERAYTASGTLSSTIYVPAAALFGRYWDGYRASNSISGTWDSKNAYRTIVHEWAHYALFLYDEYLYNDRVGAYCTKPLKEFFADETDASIMYWPYATSEFWSDATVTSGESVQCRKTEQHQFHAKDDWGTLANWYRIQGIPTDPLPIIKPTTMVPGPPSLGLTGDLFGRTPDPRLYLPLIFRSGGTVEPDTLDAEIEVHLQDNLLISDTVASQVYLLEGGPDLPTRILHQGSVVSGTFSGADADLGLITLLGIAPGDRVRIFADRYTSEDRVGGQYFYPALDQPDLEPVPGLSVEAQVNGWPADLDIAYGLNGNRITEVKIFLTSTLSLAETPIAQLCAMDTAIGCAPAWRKTMIPTGPDKWEVTFSPLSGSTEFPLYQIVRVQASGMGEIIRWTKKLGGVGPAHGGGHAPSRDGVVMVNTSSPTPNPTSCNQVVVMPAASAQAIAASLGQSSNQEIFKGVIGTPLDIDIILGNGATCPGPTPRDHTLPVSVTLTLAYNQDVIDQLGINENNLRILRYNRGLPGQPWTEVPIASSDLDLNRLSTVPVARDGIFAIVWVQ